MNKPTASDGTQLPALAGALALTPPITFNISYLALIRAESFSGAVSQRHGDRIIFVPVQTRRVQLFSVLVCFYLAAENAPTTSDKKEERNLASGKRKHETDEKKTSVALLATCAGCHHL